MKPSNELAVRLRASAVNVAAARGEKPVSPVQAFLKIFVQPRRDWKRAGAPRVGWKRGEIVEWVQARTPAERAEEWGDVGYYAAQSGVRSGGCMPCLPREKLLNAPLRNSSGEH